MERSHQYEMVSMVVIWDLPFTAAGLPVVVIPSGRRPFLLAGSWPYEGPQFTFTRRSQPISGPWQHACKGCGGFDFWL